MPKKGQGTIEYLVILAVIVVVALVVVTLMINSTSPAQGVSSVAGQTASISSPIAITEAIVSEDGNYFLKIKNNTEKKVTISEITLGDNDPASPDKDISTFGNEAFVLNTNDLCENGQPVIKKVTIKYTDEYGLEKLQTFPIPLEFQCEDYVLKISYTDNTGISYDEAGVLLSCGNNSIDAIEICDGTAPIGETCADQLGIEYIGTLACNGTCDGFIISGCSRQPIFLTTDTNNFLETETLTANILSYDDTSTYQYS